ncbi:virulence factor TspB C-terminal domain-related protein [Acinetobacter baumannii]|uniref:virulence factor TspB C-terminal domain-related protein n=1 Tax=Acinetobacter baumannii TaxID=470 RepID=UPI003CFE4285
MIHRLNIFLLSLFVALAPNFIFLQAANATTVGAEGWSVTKRLVQGATTFYDGTKNVVLNGKNYAATGTAKITPAAAQVSKMIVRVGAVVAVDLAIKALIGAVDYTMDPANNEVIYKVPGENPPATNCKTDFSDCPPQINNLWRNSGLQTTFFFTPQSACSNLAEVTKTTLTSMVQQNATNYRCYIVDSKGVANSYVVSASINPKYDPNAPPIPNTGETKKLPYDAVAAQIMSDAMAEKPEGKAFVSSVADTALEEDEQKQIVPASDITQQLNNSQAIPTNSTGTGTATPTTADPTTGDPAAATPPYDIKLNFPVFCEWAPTVCQAAQAAIAFPKTFVEKFQKWDDWLNRETKAYTYDETKLDTEDKRSFDFSIFNTNRFSVDDKCPTPEPQTITVLGVTTSFSLSLQPVCSVLELAKPALVACSYIYAAYIVIGAAKGG